MYKEKSCLRNVKLAGPVLKLGQFGQKEAKPVLRTNARHEEFEQNMHAFNKFITVNKKIRISRTACLSTAIDSFHLYLVLFIRTNLYCLCHSVHIA